MSILRDSPGPVKSSGLSAEVLMLSQCWTPADIMSGPIPEGLDDPTTWSTTPGWLRQYADFFAAMQSPMGDHVAGLLRDEAKSFDFFDATTPAELEARRLAWSPEGGAA